MVKIQNRSNLPIQLKTDGGIVFLHPLKHKIFNDISEVKNISELKSVIFIKNIEVAAPVKVVKNAPEATKDIEKKEKKKNNDVSKAKNNEGE